MDEDMIEFMKCGKYSFRVSTNAAMRPHFHHFVRLDHPILVGPEHMAVGFATLSKRSTRTGAVFSNNINFLRIAKVKKDGTPSKSESWAEYNYSDKRLDRKGIEHFRELFSLSPEYEHFFDMQVDIGSELYDQYHDYLPDRPFDDIVIRTYLDLKRGGQLRREDARLEARNRILEVRTQFLGNEPIIGLPSLKPEPAAINEQAIFNQRQKILKLQKNILESPRLAIDFTDHLELREEKEKLNRMERCL